MITPKISDESRQNQPDNFAQMGVFLKPKEYAHGIQTVATTVISGDFE